MKITKYILLFIFSTCFFILKTNASCSYKEQTILNNDLANIKITYEIVNDNEVNILIYNLTNNIYLSYKHPETKEENNIYFYNANNGKHILKRDLNNIEEYKFQVRSNISNCYGNILTTKNIIKPKYNEYHNLEICQKEELKNHSYCQEYITQEIYKNKSELEKTLEEYLDNRVGVITTTKVVEEKKISTKDIIIYSGSAIIAGIVITALIIIKKKRSDL